jgi:alpha-glucuronidase
MALAALAFCIVAASPARAESGYELWLRYTQVKDTVRRAEYRAALLRVVSQGGSPTSRAAIDELRTALGALLGGVPRMTREMVAGNSLIIGTPTSSPLIASLPLDSVLRSVGADGFVIRRMEVKRLPALVIAANRDVGVLYGVFHLLRLLQTNQPIGKLDIVSVPKIQLRMLDHWDNLDRSVERGYAGESLWNWAALPDEVSPRYRDYARANASIGINAAALTNVNANARVLTPEYLPKVAAIANELRPYGIKVFLTARFSAPIELGGLPTADPLDPSVREWWTKKIDQIYAEIPDFGGFVVKANSEGQPGPQDYKRTHADGANMLADALVSHHGVVMWRAFVYSNEVPIDRVKQAYDEFKPLDGSFHENVLVQVKNGALDFQPREPFHPLLGAMPGTPLAMEFQITKEYLGQDTHLAYLGPLFKEVLDADTWANGKGSTVARVIDGSLHGYTRTAIAGVSNVGSDSNWTGSQFNQANWYVFGRLAWDHDLSASKVADEWIRMTFTNDARAVATIRGMMMTSREAVVNYMTPLGLAHIMATGHHYGPGAWADAGRPDWTPSYYHRADSLGIGFDRTRAGSDAVAQYFPPVRDRYGSRSTVPDSVLLWFHHVRWTDRLESGRTVWGELLHRYGAGVDSARAMRRAWARVRPAIDSTRFGEVASFLDIQAREAKWWRDASLLYFQTFSKMPIPARYERPAHPLDYYVSLRCPADPRKPRCPGI